MTERARRWGANDRPLRVVVMFNPVSGSGRAARTADEILRDLSAAGHATHRLATSLDDPQAWLDPALEDADLLVVAGGDGAMHMACSSAVRTKTVIYHAPSGTENLFAREFRSSAQPAAVRAAIDHGTIRNVDVGEVNGAPFLLMASVGYDADVIHDLHDRRGGRITHFSYVAPMVRQLRRFAPTPITVVVDGERVIDAQPGIAIVANSRQYAMRLDPALRASMEDGQLDLVFLPCPSRRAVISWLVRCRRRTHLDQKTVVYAHGNSIDVQCTPARRLQVDGDPEGHEGVGEIHFGVQAGALRVLAGV